jgi:hypothetical protein
MIMLLITIVVFSVSISPLVIIAEIDGNGNGLMSLQRAIRGESGSVIEEVNQQQKLISYYPVEALNDKWAILWMQPIKGSNIPGS